MLALDNIAERYIFGPLTNNKRHEQLHQYQQRRHYRYSQQQKRNILLRRVDG